MTPPDPQRRAHHADAGGGGEHGRPRPAPPFIKVESADATEAGRRIGAACAGSIRASLAYYRSVLPDIAGCTFREARSRALRDYHPHALAAFPGLIDELRGRAEGAGVSYTDLFTVNCIAELTSQPELVSPVRDQAASDGHCTTFAVARGSRVVVAHNEDWWLGDQGNVVVLDQTTSRGTRFLAVTPACYLPVTGLNSHGVARGANTLRSFDIRPGVPEWFILRAALEARSLNEIKRIVCHPRRARGSNNLAADRRGAILDIETSARAAATMTGDGWLAHTNHYLHPDMLRHEASPGFVASRTRLARAQELAASMAQGAGDLVAAAMTALRDHHGFPGSICNHPDPDSPFGNEGATIESMVWDVTAGAMHVAVGRPCESAYRTYRLR